MIVAVVAVVEAAVVVVIVVCDEEIGYKLTKNSIIEEIFYGYQTTYAGSHCS